MNILEWLDFQNIFFTFCVGILQERIYALKSPMIKNVNSNFISRTIILMFQNTLFESTRSWWSRRVLVNFFATYCHQLPSYLTLLYFYVLLKGVYTFGIFSTALTLQLRLLNSISSVRKIRLVWRKKYLIHPII